MIISCVQGGLGDNSTNKRYGLWIAISIACQYCVSSNNDVSHFNARFIIQHQPASEPALMLQKPVRKNPSFLSHREQCELRGIYLLSVAHSTNFANFVAIVFLHIKQS